MTAYIIARIDVTDPEKYVGYQERTPAAVAKFGGRFIVRGGNSVTLEGPEEARRVVVIEFPSLDRAQAFYDSEDYQSAKKFRDGAAEAQFLAIEGV
ncbi:MAG: DUF1330 domain-containing protein [Deltaproteobacteria bacterium]|nr:DUF1330 domain-containing protein [Deltaproteobacteria bacterium]MBW2359975.1 DUF1330 domain-containing protein [Deltaproteobacteria bacterium]